MKNSEINKNLEIIDIENVKILYENTRYDGPGSGVLIYNDKKYYFKIIHEICFDDEKTEEYFLPENKKFDRIRIFGIYDLTEDEWKEEEKWHSLFQKYVGEHLDHDEDGKIDFRKVKPEEEWHKFYDKYNKSGQRNFLKLIDLAYYMRKTDFTD